MADQADVETALVSIAANALYSNGFAAASAVGGTCRVYRGLPNAPALGADLAAGALHVTVAASADVKNTTRFPRKWQIVAPVPATLAVTMAPQSARFSGRCAAGQLAGIAVDGATFPYAVQANDSPATVASNMAALLRAAGWLVEYAGTTLTVPNAARFTARVVSGANALQEIKRQDQKFQITLWCPTPALRDAAGSLIDEAFATLPFIALADGSSARLIYAGSDAEDGAADAALYKRMLRYSADYPTTLAQVTPAMLFGTGRFDADAAFVETLNG
jgi:hypothetical protein